MQKILRDLDDEVTRKRMSATLVLRWSMDAHRGAPSGRPEALDKGGSLACRVGDAVRRRLRERERAVRDSIDLLILFDG